VTRIRTATDGDLLAVASLYQQLAPEPDPPLRRASRRQLDAWEEMLRTPNLTVLVAEEDDAIVGTACLLLMPSLTDDCASTGFLENMVVDRGRRRTGVGRSLIDEIVRRAHEGGCRRLQLLSHNDHVDDAHVFYKSCGFVSEAAGFRRYIPARP